MIFDIRIGDIIKSDDGTVSIHDAVSTVPTAFKYKARIIKQSGQTSSKSFLSFDIHGCEADYFEKDINIVASVDKPLEPESRNNIFIKKGFYIKNNSYMNHLFEYNKHYEFTNDLLLYSNEKTFNISYKQETLRQLLKGQKNG